MILRKASDLTEGDVIRINTRYYGRIKTVRFNFARRQFPATLDLVFDDVGECNVLKDDYVEVICE